MVAFSSSRRKRVPSAQPGIPDTLVDPGPTLPAAASRRVSEPLAVERGHGGVILGVRIGPWRTLSASTQRRIAEVRELEAGRVAVRIERFADGGGRASSQIWQLYDRQGRLEASLQSTPDGRFAVQTNYVTRQASRMVLSRENEWETVETWRL